MKPDTIPTYAHNWCVSPLTPMAVSGVMWIPGQANMGYSSEDYTAELEIYARSLPATYGQDQVLLLYAHPSSKLIPGMIPPKIEHSVGVEFEQWPKGLREIAVGLGTAIESTQSKAK